MANFLLLKIMLVGRECVTNAVICESQESLGDLMSIGVLLLFKDTMTSRCKERSCDSLQPAGSKLAPQQDFSRS